MRPVARPLIVLTACAAACSEPVDTGDPKPHDTSDSGGDAHDTGETSPPDTGETDDTGAPVARWTFAVFMNGDNNLEDWVVHDLNELEWTGSGDGVHVVVQADRIDGYDTSDGDWTGTRRYYIEPDQDGERVASPVLADLGEQDMGDPAVLSDFLLWADETYPAERFALVMWDHGSSWTFTGSAPPEPPYISDDETSGHKMSIAAGHLHEALEALVERRGPLDIIGFDACLMASWEVATTLQDQALVMAAAETSVDVEGYQYAPVVELMRTQPDATAAEIADEMARGSVEIGGEATHSAMDLTVLPRLTTAIDALAGAAQGSSDRQAALLSARDGTGTIYFGYHDWYIDIGQMGANLVSADPDLAPLAEELVAAQEATVIGAYAARPWSFTTGLHLFFDLDDFALDLYSNGEGATWSQETRWDDLLREMNGE